MSLCYSVLFAQRKQKRRRGGTCIRKPSHEEHVGKAQESPYMDDWSSEEDCSPVAKRVLTDWESKVEEPGSEQKIKDESYLGGNSGQAKKGWVFTDDFYEIVPPERERKSYMIRTKDSRKYNTVYSPEVPPMYDERSVAALSDAINFLNDALGTTSVSAKEPYEVHLLSYAAFECNLSDAEYKLVKGHEDVEEISVLMTWYEFEHVY